MRRKLDPQTERRIRLVEKVNQIFWRENPGQMAPPLYFFSTDTLAKIVERGTLKGANYEKGEIA